MSVLWEWVTSPKSLIGKEVHIRILEKNKMKQYKHHIIPVVFGILVGVLTLLFDTGITKVLTETSINQILFTYSITLFGFILASYGIFFSIVPNLKESVKKSDQLLKINKYFYVCLAVILIQVIFSVIYFFSNYYYFFVGIAALFGVTIVMFYFMITGVKDLFDIILKS